MRRWTKLDKNEKIETDAEVTLAKAGDGFIIIEILLKTKGRVKNIDKEEFILIAGKTKENCPVSKALTGTKIILEAEIE